MRPTPARLMTLAAGLTLVLSTAACTSSGSGPAGPSTRLGTGGTTTTRPTAAAPRPASTTPTAATPAATTPAATGTGIPAGAHHVPASGYQVGTDDYHGAAHAMPGIVQFTTPSGNIACTVTPGSSPTLYCSITEHEFALPARPASCTLNWAGGLMTLDARSATLGLCVGGETVTAHSRTLAYGDELTTRGIACYSGRDALTCTAHRHGFELSRTVVHTV